MTGEHRYMQWLCSIPGLYYPLRQALLSRFGSAEAIFSARDEELSVFGKENGRQVETLREHKTQRFLEENESRLKKTGISFAAFFDEVYPASLRRIADRPAGIFYRGNIRGISEETILSVAVVGARACSSYGLLMSTRIAEELAGSGIVVISGMAEGIDSAAQQAVLDAGGLTAAVLGCGVDICYPSSSRQIYERLVTDGCVLSEYPCRTRPLPAHFPFRNRIISGLSDVTAIVEARERSGSLITADYALEQGKDVYALPGRSTDDLSRGTNRLISQGAGVILSADAWVRELQTVYPEKIREDIKEKAGTAKKKVVLAWDEELVYSLLDLSPAGPEEIAFRSGLKASLVQGVLLRLELKGMIRTAGLNQYVKQQ